MSIGRYLPIMLLLGVMDASADIVWQGKRVDHWPSEALPELQRKVLGKLSANTSGLGLYPNPAGTIKGLTLLIDFSDQASLVSKQDIDDWLNLPGFNKDDCNGSIRDYFYDASNGAVEFKNQVFGFYRAKNTKAYYDGGSDYERASELLNEVLNAFDSQVNFADFDNDKDGNTEAISIVYAGAGKTWGQGIWPHSGWIGQKRDGVNLTRYMMTDMPGTFSIYVFAHESGHMVFGWPDLYWFGDYCLMGNRMNDQNPVLINDFFRADQGWIPVADVDATTNGTFIATEDSLAYRYPNPNNAKEGFFWSNIRNTGRNTSLRGSGLVLYHYDMGKIDNSSATNLVLRIVQADNQAHLQADQWPSPGSAANDPFQANTSDEFSASTSQYSAWYNGSASNLRIWDISNAQREMTFKMGAGINPTCNDTIAMYFHTNENPWAEGTEVLVAAGDSLVLGPHPNETMGWSWTGPGSFASTERQIVIRNIDKDKAGAYTAFYTSDLCHLQKQFTLQVQEASFNQRKNKDQQLVIPHRFWNLKGQRMGAPTSHF